MMSTCTEEIPAKPHYCHINPADNAPNKRIILGVQTHKGSKRGQLMKLMTPAD
jgi:hypothetical protein